MTAIDTLLVRTLSAVPSGGGAVVRLTASREALDAIMRADGASLWPVKVWGVPIHYDPALDDDGIVVVAVRGDCTG